MKTIISIEDNNQTINEIAHQLGDGINIVSINNNFKDITVEQIKSFNPALILLDIELLGENDKTGIEIAKMLQAQNIPIIMLSCRTEYKKYLIDNKLCRWFLSKPIHAAIVLEKIQEILR